MRVGRGCLGSEPASRTGDETAMNRS